MCCKSQLFVKCQQSHVTGSFIAFLYCTQDPTPSAAATSPSTSCKRSMMCWIFALTSASCLIGCKDSWSTLCISWRGFSLSRIRCTSPFAAMVSCFCWPNSVFNLYTCCWRNSRCSCIEFRVLWAFFFCRIFRVGMARGCETCVETRPEFTPSLVVHFHPK